MKRKLKPEDETTLIALRDRLLLTIQFFESVQDFPSGERYRKIVERIATEGSLRDMHLFARDIEAMTIALTPHEQDGLEALLLSRLGVDREAEYAAVQQSVAKVLRRGTIASEKERRRLEEYADMLDATGGDPAEIEAVRRLLRFG